MDHKPEIDAVTGTETTGHSWDGIQELNTPLPRWWLWTFYACIIFSIGYMVLYPAWPMLNGATKGILGWTSRGQLETQETALIAANQGLIDKVISDDLAQIKADPELYEFARQGGESIFKLNCVQCHGTGAIGGPGYPNLNDDSWLWGGQMADIHDSILNGIRFSFDPNTRISDMPAFGRDKLLTPEQIMAVASYVRKLSGQSHEAATIQQGETIYTDNCASCHGGTGEGNKDLGAPQLNDAIWLYGGTEQDIVKQIENPRQGVMPAWGDRLGDVAVKQLTIYVHSLGGGQ